MTVCEHTDRTQLKAASPNVKLLVVRVRQRHLISDGDVHSMGVYSDLMKLSTQSLAQSGTMSYRAEFDASSAAERRVSMRRIVMSILWIGRRVILR
jgi:hypothetical protein